MHVASSLVVQNTDSLDITARPMKQNSWRSSYVCKGHGSHAIPALYYIIVALVACLPILSYGHQTVRENYVCTISSLFLLFVAYMYTKSPLVLAVITTHLLYTSAAEAYICNFHIDQSNLLYISNQTSVSTSPMYALPVILFSA